MLEVVSLEEAAALVRRAFSESGAWAEGAGAASGEDPVLGEDAASVEILPLGQAVGRRIAHDVVALEGVPSFDRSTVDGFAVVAADTFGCSDALPALLDLAGEIEMGVEPACSCMPGSCVRIPTGGQVPAGADAVVMLEYCEEYGDGTIGVARAVAPGENIVFENDDVKPGQVLIDAGTILMAHHIGTLASLGVVECEVLERRADGAFSDDATAGSSTAAPMKVAVISTGDEIVDVSQEPVASQMRDVNAPMLAAALEALGVQAVRFPIVPDDYDALLETVQNALATCDMVLVSGGSSAGQKDNTARVLSELGTLLFHGIAVKPGKPTMCADVHGVPAFGLPGHPVAAYFLFLELVRPLILNDWEGYRISHASATLSAGIPSNHGRSELVAVRLEQRDGVAYAVPVRGKSGLISQLSQADGFIAIGRNQEGLAAGAEVDVRLF